jgi:murein DD-endopeptidase MepM/ murein hydrolase activator NlpD
MYQQQPYYPDEEEWEYPEEEIEYYEEWYNPEEELEFVDSWEYPDGSVAPIPQTGVLITVAAILFMFFVLIRIGSTSWPEAHAASQPESVVVLTPLPTLDPLAFAAPYTDYTLTQGIHGASYGHMAIDLASGRGSPVLSPINGVITNNYTDQWGNTAILIENDVYRVLILHGDFFASTGTEVQLGDQVGTESNHGYTTDMNGNLCNGRVNCGNHTHLNVFDKRAGANTNPLDLLRP